jgi:hypothetical protein
VEQLMMRTRQHADDQPFKKQDSQKIGGNFDSRLQDNFGETTTGKTPFGGLRKKVNE